MLILVMFVRLHPKTVSFWKHAAFFTYTFVYS